MKIIQLTDCHLFADDSSELFGVKSNLKFKEVVQKIHHQDQEDLMMFFLTGDLSQDETSASYQKVVEQLSPFKIPVYWVPGNHDDLSTMAEVFNASPHFKRATSLAVCAWSFIFLNTKIEGAPDGFLSATELATLKNELTRASQQQKKIAIIMHHHPAEVGTPLIDRHILRNRQEFWDTVANIKIDLIMCGHVHGDYHFKYNDIQIESSPATCLQWQKGTDDLKLDLRTGYKVYYFNDDNYNALSKME